MSAFYNPEDIKKISECGLVLDTNLLTSLSSDEEYFQEFIKIFKGNIKLIDPIVRIEFLRDASGGVLKNKMVLLEYKNFSKVTDHQEIYKKSLEEVTKISRIYAYHGNPNIPLGDLLIVSRLSLLEDHFLFATLDKSDFSTILFDRIAITSIERKIKPKDGKPPRDIIDHIALLRFNKEKYANCCAKLKL